MRLTSAVGTGLCAGQERLSPMAPWAGTSSGTDHTGCGVEKPPKVTWVTSFEARASRVSTTSLRTLGTFTGADIRNDRYVVCVIQNLMEFWFIQSDGTMLQHISNFAISYKYNPILTSIFLSIERRREVSYENSCTVRVEISYAAPRKFPRPAT